MRDSHTPAVDQCRQALQRSPLLLAPAGKRGRVPFWQGTGPQRFTQRTVDTLIATGEAVRKGDTITRRKA